MPEPNELTFDDLLRASVGVSLQDGRHFLYGPLGPGFGC